MPVEAGEVYDVTKPTGEGFSFEGERTAGDKVEWVYTCDLGNDVGGNYSARNGN